MKIILKPDSNKNIIATIAIGQKYFNEWEKYAKPSWIKYCFKNGLGLIVFDKNLINSNHKKWKKPTWQKGLIGDYLIKKKKNIQNVCYLDSDIIINPNAPNIFKYHDPNKISLVSHRFKLPYKYYNVLEKIAFYRHHFYTKKYPLDSSLFISLKKVYEIHGLIPQKDEACMGLIVFNVKKYSNFFKEIFLKYDRNVSSFTNNGDQIHYNYEIQHNTKVNWLDYKFQTLWLFEMAWNYPFLYKYKNNKNSYIKDCVETSLSKSYFLHFAGSWYESNMWKIKNIYLSKKILKLQSNFYQYNQLQKKGAPKGQVKPNKR